MMLSLAEKKKQLTFWGAAFVVVLALFAVSNVLLVQLYGQINWTGVKYSAIINILNLIVNGIDISTAVTTVVGMALAGPIIGVIAIVGRRLLIRWIKQRGIASVARW
jgi:hypothetical protein